MFTTKTVYKICCVLLGAVSVRAIKPRCWVTPDIDGVVNIPDGTETIPGEAFYRCLALKTLNIPASVLNIGSYRFSPAFWLAINLETVIFEEGSLLEFIGRQAFVGTRSLKNITFPANLKEITWRAFEYSGLEEVIFEEGSNLVTIGFQAFYGNQSLQTFTFPANLKEIGGKAFDRCHSLKMITLPANLKVIWSYAFYYSGLEEVIFEEGSELEKIGNVAFYGSRSLQTINIPSGVKIKSRAFKDTGCPEDIFTPGATIVDCRVTV